TVRAAPPRVHHRRHQVVVPGQRRRKLGQPLWLCEHGGGRNSGAKRGDRRAAGRGGPAPQGRAAGRGLADPKEAMKPNAVLIAALGALLAASCGSSSPGSDGSPTGAGGGAGSSATGGAGGKGAGGATGSGGAPDAGTISCTIDGGQCPAGTRYACGGPGIGTCACHAECSSDNDCAAPNTMCGCSANDPLKICVNACFCLCG